MKALITSFFVGLALLISSSCAGDKSADEVNIIYLHHSTGEVIWEGDLAQTLPEAMEKRPRVKSQLPVLFSYYNKKNSTSYSIVASVFPKAEIYGWNNYPFDYYNIWVKNAGEKAFLKEPTLEMLTDKYDIIIFKHCFPVGNILSDNEVADINSDRKSLQNYILQYLALRDKMHQFPENKFILFTGAVHVQAFISEEEAIRAREFHNWVTEVWDQPDDNIFLWDLYELQTEGDLYFQEEHAVSSTDSHPNKEFAGRASNLLFNRIIDVIENDGMTTDLVGNKI